MVAGKISVADIMVVIRRDNTDANHEEKTYYHSSKCQAFEFKSLVCHRNF